MAKGRKMSFKLTNEEFEMLVEEISERIKDVVYMTLKERVRKTLKLLNIKKLKPTNQITFEWKVDFVVGDLIQILGRHRRKKGKQA